MKKMNKLPKGEFYNVRFDIDDSGFNSFCYNGCKIMSPDHPNANINCNLICDGTSSCEVFGIPPSNCIELNSVTTTLKGEDAFMGYYGF